MNPGRMVHLGSRESLDLRATMEMTGIGVMRVSPDILEALVSRVKGDIQVLMVKTVDQVFRVDRAAEVSLDHPDRLDSRVFRAVRDRLDRLDRPGRPENAGRGVKLGLLG